MDNKRDLLDGNDWNLKCRAAEMLLAYNRENPVPFAEIKEISTGPSHTKDEIRGVTVQYYELDLIPPPFFPLKYKLKRGQLSSRWFQRVSFVSQMSADYKYDARKIHDRREKVLGMSIPSYIGYGFQTPEYHP